MTRDEVCQILEHPLHNTSEFALKRNRQVLAHDQAQRETIEQQVQEIKSLTNQFHENLERQAKRVGELEAKIEQQVKEIAQWKAAAQMHNGVYEPLQQENKALREVLQAICSGISGDLLGTTSMDRETMQSIAQQALKEVS